MLHPALALLGSADPADGPATNVETRRRGGPVGAFGDATEAELVARVSSGDRRAMRLVYDRFGARIHRFLRDLCGGDAPAWDATQETFARAFNGMQSLRDDARLGPFLFGIARNVSREQRKRTRRDLALGEEVVAQTDSVGRATPESIALGAEALRIVERALDALPEHRRAALLMRVDHHLPYDEIAESLGWSVAKAKIEVFRGRESLRRALVDEESSQ